MKKFIIYAVIIFAFLAFCSACNFLGFNSEADEEEHSEYKTLEMMQGFWMLTGYKGEVSEKIKQSGVALHIYNSNFDMYAGFILKSEKTKINLSEGNIVEYNMEGKTHKTEVSFDIKDGYEIMILNGDDGYMQFEKCSKELYFLYKDFAENSLGSYEFSIYLEDELTDKELAWYIADAYWNEWYYLYPDGTYSEMDPYSMVLYSSDMSGIMNYVEEKVYVAWEVYEKKRYLTYQDGDVYFFPIDYRYDSTTGYAYLYLYDTEEGYENCAWVLWDYVE